MNITTNKQTGFPHNQIFKLMIQLGHLAVPCVPGNLWLDHLLKEGLHNPPSKYSTNQVIQNVKPLLHRALIQDWRSPVELDVLDYLRQIYSTYLTQNYL